MKDEILIEKLKSDPNEAMRILTKDYAGLVLSIVRGVLRGFPEKDAEECAADTFSEFYLENDRFDFSKGTIKAYLCVMAKHNALDKKRQEERRRAIETDLDPESQYKNGGGPEEKALEVERKRKLNRALEALGTPDQEIIVRKYYMGQSSKEIARRLGMTQGNVDVRTHRALVKLRELLEGGE